MCGRFTLTLRSLEELARALGVEPAAVAPEDIATYHARYNIAPRQPHWILCLEREDRRLLTARWGLVNRWARDDRAAVRQINARAETVNTRSAYREAFRHRRCAIPADGFFEWTGPKAARRPLWYHRADGGLVLFAGLYETWQPLAAAGGSPPSERTFTIITTAANNLIAPVHDRMPAILLDDEVDDWLHHGAADVGRLRALLAPAPDDLLVATSVSMRVNSVRHDDPDCLAVEEPTPEP